MKISFITWLNVLLTFLLFASIFFGVSTSQPSYDPWLDVTDDGYGGIDDIVSTAEHFGAAGDPMKNVNVTNWSSPWKVITIAENVAVPIPQNPQIVSFYFGVPNIEVEGFSRMFIYVTAANFSETPGSEVQFGIKYLDWKDKPNAIAVLQDVWDPYFSCTQGDVTYKGVQEFTTLGPYVEIGLGIYSPISAYGTAEVTMRVYLRCG